MGDLATTQVIKSMKVWGLEAELSWMIRSGRFPESLRRAFDGEMAGET